jgi:hypothetical protein
MIRRCPDSSARKRGNERGGLRFRPLVVVGADPRDGLGNPGARRGRARARGLWRRSFGCVASGYDYCAASADIGLDPLTEARSAARVLAGEGYIAVEEMDEARDGCEAAISESQR